MKILASLSTFLLLALFGALVPATPAMACACCAEPGERTESASKIGTYEKSLLKELKFASKATLFLPPGGFEDIIGLKGSEDVDSHLLKVTKTRKYWRFSFDDQNGNRGRLQLKLPKYMQKFSVDTRPQPAGATAPREVLLYKELTLKTTATGTGAFIHGAKRPVKARLILHGAGNSCDTANQFTHWSLDVSDQRAKYRFFGKLTPVH